MKIIGKGEFGIVYETIHNNINMVAKVFSENKDYQREKEIYTKVLPINCGKLILNNVVCIFVDNINYKLNDYIYLNYTITIHDSIILNKINNILLNIFGEITFIKFKLRDYNDIIGYTTTSNHNIGRILIENDEYLLQIDTFKFIRLLDFQHKVLYFQNLGINLLQYLKNEKPPLDQRIYMCIDLVRQLSELTNRKIYHNDIKCENLLIKVLEKNYYINIIDFGITISINDKELKEPLYTTSTAYSPEYVILYNNYVAGIKSIDMLKDVLDNSSHWIIAGMIINIIVWKNVQYETWIKYYYANSNINSLKLYTNKHNNYNYIIDLLYNFIHCDCIYINIENKIINNENIKQLIKINCEKHNLFEILFDVLKNNIIYYKPELIPIIVNVFDLLDYSIYQKKSLNNIYDEVKDYKDYNNYLLSKLIFI